MERLNSTEQDRICEAILRDVEVCIENSRRELKSCLQQHLQELRAERGQDAFSQASREVAETRVQDEIQAPNVVPTTPSMQNLVKRVSANRATEEQSDERAKSILSAWGKPKEIPSAAVPLEAVLPSEPLEPPPTSEEDPRQARSLWGKAAAKVKTTNMLASPVVSPTSSRKRNKTKLGAVFASASGEQLDQQKDFWGDLVASRTYQGLSTALILTNGFFIGFQTQAAGVRAEEYANLNPPVTSVEPDEFLIIGVLFNLLFTVELAIHWYADGFWPFFFSEDRNWNILDIIVVLTGMVDTVFDLNYLLGDRSQRSTGSVSVLRVLRVCRVVRVVRVIRVMKFFRELRMMIYSVTGSFKTLLWVISVVGAMCCLFGINFTEATVGHLSKPEDWNNDMNKDLIEKFGTLDRSVLSLFMAMSGGDDWGNFYQAIRILPGESQIIFLFYIVLSVFAVFNIVTGIFVDAAMQINSKDKDVAVQEQLENSREMMSELKDLFVELDVDSSGALTKAELVQSFDNEKVKAYFNTMKVQAREANMLFDLLDFNSSGHVSIDEFVDGINDLQGEATAIDAKLMQYEVRVLKDAVLNLIPRLKKDMGEAQVIPIS